MLCLPKSGLQALDAAVCAVHRDVQTVADVAASADGTHDGGLEQGLAGDGGVAVQAGFLDHQSGSVTDKGRRARLGGHCTVLQLICKIQDCRETEAVLGISCGKYRKYSRMYFIDV